MSMTKTAAVMGSPLYMSPEQMQSSRDVDSRTDIWALGVVLFELLTGKVPFSGATLPEICVTIATKPPPPLRQLRDDAPAALERAINKCLEKDRGQRYRNVAELAYALVEFAPKRGRVSAEKVAGIIQGAGLAASAEAQPSSYENDRARSPGTLASWGQKTAPPPAGRRGWLAIVMAAVILVAGFAGAVLLKRNRELQNEPTVVVASELAVTPSSNDHPLSTSANVLPVVVSPTSPPAGAAAVPIPDPAASVFKAPPLPEGVLKRSGPAIRPAKPAPEKRSEAIADPPAPPSSHVAPPAPPPVRAPPPADPADLGGRL
jgi:serine/threonine-protein kinase